LLAAKKDDARITAAAAALDEVVLVAAAEAPGTLQEIQFGILEELRALRGEVAVSLYSETPPNLV
jgi:hypothetical protein